MMISTSKLSLLQPAVMMSSREIAQMIGITHGEVKRFIKSLETTQRLSQPLAVGLYELEERCARSFV